MFQMRRFWVLVNFVIHGASTQIQSLLIITTQKRINQLKRQKKLFRRCSVGMQCTQTNNFEIELLSTIYMERGLRYKVTGRMRQCGRKGGEPSKGHGGTLDKMVLDNVVVFIQVITIEDALELIEQIIQSYCMRIWSSYMEGHPSPPMDYNRLSYLRQKKPQKVLQ